MLIRIHDHQVPVQLGCTKEERAYPQIVSFQIELEVGDEQSAASDALEDTIDYMQVLQAVENIAKEKEFHLLEHLGGTVGREILSLSPLVLAARIVAAKHIAPNTAGISVEIEVLRDSL